jgi:hypothetical protein
MLATAVLAADYAATLDLTETSEVRIRTTRQFDVAPGQPSTTGPAPLGFDLYEAATARLHAYNHRWDWFVTYAPTLVLPDLEVGVTPLLLNNGGVSGVWHDRYLRLTLGEDGTYGFENSAYLVAAQPVPGQPPVQQPATPPTNIQFAYSRSYASFGARLDRQNSLTLGAEYFWRGGVDPASQATFPDQQGVLGSVLVEHEVSRIDRLSTLASVQTTTFSTVSCTLLVGQTIPAGATCAPQYVISSAEETLSHQASRTVGFTLGAGGAVVNSRYDNSIPYQTVVYPVAEASMAMRLGREKEHSLVLLARLAPYVNTVQAIVTNNLIGEATLTEPLSQRVGMRVDVGMGQTIPPQQAGALSLVRGEISFLYHVSAAVDVTLGERSFWQQLSGTGPFVTAIGFVGLAYHPHELKL